MKVSLASAMGTCFGVQDAINLAMSPEFASDLTIVGQLVHNPQVSKSLKQNGVSLVPGIEDIEKIKTKKVMITAHGAAEKTKKQLNDAGFIVYDASCPLVMRVHKTIKSMVTKGYFPVVIGQKDHVEVKGIVGDLDDHLVINSEDDFSKIKDSGNRNWESSRKLPSKPIKSRTSWKKSGLLIMWMKWHLSTRSVSLPMTGR